ncbi:hypothetical protein [Solidesulfovibrio sp.]|jgi:hypothetical protein|uniref:hypothetical protein n=1 Tax=Solidesulfovibrio sp. TaxID=2910990 RepID=UPI002B20E2F3|nr:hypothetical protein [Solidesulfovibrio sp.]MEA5090564.1 hypothetical protein [Solidesulfovibrio sp.]
MGETPDVMEKSRTMGLRAGQILDALGLVRAWSRFGRPVLVGAVAHDLALDPDIDMEIYCPVLRPEDGFAVLAQASRHPGVGEALFQNHMHGPDKALYWMLRFTDDDGVVWKIDMWSAPDDYALPRGEDLVAPLARALTPEMRRAILELKAWRTRTPDASFLSVDLYRAVVSGGVRDVDGLRDWLERNETGVLTDWKPE